MVEVNPFIKSLSIHVGVILLLMIYQWITNYSGETLRQNNIELVKRSVRVDMLAMPKETLQELKKIQEAIDRGEKAGAVAPKTETPDTGGSDTVFEKKSEKKSLDDLIKNLGQKKTEAEKRKVPDKKSDVGKDRQAEIQQLIAAGNKIEKGASLVGDSAMSGEELTVFNAYASRLPEHVKPAWTLPSYLLNKDLRCRIRIFLASNGRLIKAQVYESSGVIEYDNRALEAVQNSSPFPPLEASIAKRALNGSILLGFPL